MARCWKAARRCRSGSSLCRRRAWRGSAESRDFEVHLDHDPKKLLIHRQSPLLARRQELRDRGGGGQHDPPGDRHARPRRDEKEPHLSRRGGGRVRPPERAEIRSMTKRTARGMVITFDAGDLATVEVSVLFLHDADGPEGLGRGLRNAGTAERTGARGARCTPKRVERSIGRRPRSDRQSPGGPR